VIVTFNTKDFPNAVLEGYGVKAQHPDPFLCQLLKKNPQGVLRALQKQRTTLTNPPKDQDAFIASLETRDLPMFAALLKKNKEQF
jgi:hypothetical protein